MLMFNILFWRSLTHIIRRYTVYTYMCVCVCVSKISPKHDFLQIMERRMNKQWPIYTKKELGLGRLL